MSVARRGLTVVILAALLAVGVRLVTGRPRTAPARGSGATALWPAPPPSPLAALTSATAWLNTSEPVTPASLTGQVTLVVFWAYSDVRALEILPVLAQWYARYHDHGLEIIAVHTPEFPFERAVANVQQAVERLAIPCPVAVDSDRRIWTAFRAYEWPSYYVADPDGALVGFQAGAGREAEVEVYLRGLLVEQGHPVAAEPVFRRAGLRSALGEALRSSQTTALRSPEMVFQLPLGDWFVGPQGPVVDQPRVYDVPEPLPLHAAALDGVWQFEEDRVRVVSPTARLVVHYRAARCHLVVEGAPGQTLEVRVDGEAVPTALAGPDLTVTAAHSLVRLDQPRAYTVVQGAPAEPHTLDVTLPRGVVLYACTFGE